MIGETAIPSPTYSLALRVSIPEAVRTWQSCAEDVRKAFELLASAEERLSAVFGTDDHGVHIDTRHYLNVREPETTVRYLRDQCWRQMVERMQIKQVMSIKRAEALDRQLYDGHRCGNKEDEELPDITIENVMGIISGMHASIPEMANEAIREVFEWLRPHHNRYKSNEPYEIGGKVVIEYGCELGYAGRSWHVDYHRENQFRALDNVFAFLDGRGFSAKTHHGELVDAINAAGKDGRFETRYFSGRCFKNRNVHLTFKRPDLVAKLNQAAGGMRLRGSE